MKQIFIWNRCLRLMEEHKFIYELYSDYVLVKKDDYTIIGKFFDPEHLQQYLYGYDKAKSEWSWKQ